MSAPAATAVDIPARVELAVAAMRDRKATELKVLHLEPVTDVTDYFLICSGASQRQVQAIAEAVKDRLRRDVKVRPLHVEGVRRACWVLLDYGDFVVHVFDDATRSFYDLERLWSDAPDVTAEFGR